MGKFSGILICSDFDGTLAHHGEIPAINFQKIKYFCDNGGNFSIITGRSGAYFDKFKGALCIDTYMGYTNGTVIRRFPSGETVICDYVRDDVFKGVISLCDKFDKIKNIDLYPDDEPICFEGSAAQIKKSLEGAQNIKIHKFLMRTLTQVTDEDVELIKAHMGAGCAVSRSWEFGIEFQNGNFHKGVAARRIAELLGANRLITVGDYENDVPLLMAGDESYASQNALDSVKAVANHVLTRTSGEGAIAELIDILDNRL